MTQTLIVFFTKYCLGTLSEIYYKAQTHILDSKQLFSGLVCRALVGMFAYDKLLESQTIYLVSKWTEAPDSV